MVVALSILDGVPRGRTRDGKEIDNERRKRIKSWGQEGCKIWWARRANLLMAPFTPHKRGSRKQTSKEHQRAETQELKFPFREVHSGLANKTLTHIQGEWQVLVSRLWHPSWATGTSAQLTLCGASLARRGVKCPHSSSGPLGILQYCLAPNR